MNPTAPDGAARNGALKWRLRQSFRAYVTSLPDGEERVGGGAWTDDDGCIVFPSAEINSLSVAEETVHAFLGSLTFTGHGGVLSVHLSDIRVHLVDEGRSTVLVTSGDAGQGEHQAIASFRDWEVLNGCVVVPEPRLTWIGATLLGGVYDVGDLLDPIEIDLNRVRQPE